MVDESVFLRATALLPKAMKRCEVSYYRFIGELQIMVNEVIPIRS